MNAIIPIPLRKTDVHGKQGRESLSKMVVKLFELWGLNTGDQAVLLGLSSDSRSTVARYKKGSPLADNADLIGRAGHLLGIHKSLRILFPHNRDLAYRWVATPNRRFDGQTPLSIMTEGYEGLLAVRRYLDFERGR